MKKNQMKISLDCIMAVIWSNSSLRESADDSPFSTDFVQSAIPSVPRPFSLVNFRSSLGCSYTWTLEHGVE
jgi:hypothetical protein